MPNRDWNNVNWVQARVNGEHHQALTRYLIGRTPVQAAKADEAGLTVDEIVRQGFSTTNGHTTVPQCAIKLVRHETPSLSLSLVVSLCRGSSLRAEHMKNLAKALRKTGNTSEEARAVIDEATVRDVIES